MLHLGREVSVGTALPRFVKRSFLIALRLVPVLAEQILSALTGIVRLFDDKPARMPLFL